MINCLKCKEEIKVDETAYHILRGIVLADDSVEIDKGVGFLHEGCCKEILAPE